MIIASGRLLHPLPTFPVEGEVLLHSFGSIQPNPPACTSPLMGETGRGWGPDHASLDSSEVLS